MVLDGTTQPVRATNCPQRQPFNRRDGRGLYNRCADTTVKGLAIDSFAGDGLILKALGCLDQRRLYRRNSRRQCRVGKRYRCYFQNGAHGNVLSGCLISGNSTDGVLYWRGTTTTGNVIAGNKIGTDATGTARSATAATASTFGPVPLTTPSAGRPPLPNVISANVNDGVFIDGGGSAAVIGTVVEGNYIGTDASGSVGYGNGNAGVYLWSTASGNTVGGTSAGGRNIISANTEDGVICTTPPAATRSRGTTSAPMLLACTLWVMICVAVEGGEQ